MPASPAPPRTSGRPCEHKRSYSLAELERTVLDGMKEKLTDTKALIALTRAYHARWAERRKEVRSERDKVQRELNRATVQIDRLVTAIAETDEPVKGLVDKIKVLETERIALEGRLALIDGETGGADKVVSLHPAVLDRFRDDVVAIHNASLTGRRPSRSGRRSVTFLFERVVVHQTRPMERYEVTPYARISAVLGVELFKKGRTVEEMLSEQGVKHCLVRENEDSQFCQTGLY